MKNNLVLSESNIKPLESKKLGDCVKVYSVELDKALMENATQTALVRIQSTASYPGFRTGKVPLSMVRTQFQPYVREEVIELAVKTALPKVIDTYKLNPVVQPVLKNVKYEEEKSLYFELQIEIPPVIEPKSYTDIPVDKKVTEIKDKDIEDYINKVREYNAYLKPAKEDAAVSNKNFVMCNYETWENGAKIEGGEVKSEVIDMSAKKQPVAGIAEALKGAKRGETREFEAPIDGKDGKKVLFKVTVTEIKDKIVPPVDENFLKEAGVKTEEELRSNVKKMLEQRAGEETEKEVVRQIEDMLIKKNPLPLPPTLVREEAKELLSTYSKQLPEEALKGKEEELIEKMKPLAERNLTVSYIFHYIAKKENLQVTEAELQGELDKVLVQMKSETEKNKARELFRQRRDYIAASMLENKTISFLKDKASIKEKKA